jgi:hypothetical protein
MFRQSGSRVRVYGKPGKRRSALWMILSGLVGFAVFAVFGASTSSEYSSLGSMAAIYGAIAISVGGIAWLVMSKGITFDSTTRSVSGGSNSNVDSYDSFSAVRLRKEIVQETTYSREGGPTTVDVTYYCLDLIRVDKGYDISEIALGSSSEEGLEILLCLPGWRVVMHTDELQVWRLSERIARDLKVLHVDAIGDPAVTRFANELDTPMVELLGRRIVVPPVYAEDHTESVEVEGTQTTVHFTSENEWVGLCVMSCIAAAALAIAGYSAGISLMLQICLGLVALFALAALAMHFTPRSAKVIVDADLVRFRPGWGFRRKIRVKILESIRIEGHFRVSLLSDHKVVRFSVADEGGGPWLRDEIVRALARTRDLAVEAPYR